MKTEKDWEQFGRDLKKAMEEDAKMSDEDWEKFLAQIPEAPSFDENEADAVIAFAVKRSSPDSHKRPVEPKGH